MSHAPDYADLLVVGGGTVGLALALAVKQAMGDGFKVELWEPTAGSRPPPQRVSAIAAGPRRMLERLGVWQELAPRAQAILRMEITDSKLEDVVRPIFLGFADEIEPGEPFAHMVGNADLDGALERRALNSGVSLHADSALDVVSDGGATVTTSSSGRRLRALLTAAADGARSPLREAAGIGSISWSYAGKAIVCTIEHEREHDGCARQHFLPDGPFAILPLTGRRSSIVWTAPDKIAGELLGLPRDRFLGELKRRFGPELGCLELLDAPLQFDLRFNLARSLVAPRLALAGDAAHTIHPLAGQGLNLGLRDVAALAEVIADHARLGLDHGGPEPLRLYERMRRFDTFAMALAADALGRLFSLEGPMRPARDLGMALVDRRRALKKALIGEAAGINASSPRLLRGDSL